MSYRDIRQIKLRIDSLIIRIKGLKGTAVDIEIESDLSKYLCVLLSGYFEKSITDIINTYAEKFSPQIERCVQIEFKWTTNIKMARLLEILDNFSTEWKNIIENDPSYDDYKDTLDSIVNNRNNISHAQGSSVTLAQLEYHYTIIEEIIDKIRSLFVVYQRSPYA